MRKILFFGVVLALLQQWCGINVIFYYAKDVFAAAGYEVSDILLNIVIVGLANLHVHLRGHRTRWTGWAGGS